MAVDREAIVEALTDKYPFVTWALVDSDPEIDGMGETLPPKIVLLANANLHGALPVPVDEVEDQSVNEWVRAGDRLWREMTGG